MAAGKKSGGKKKGKGGGSKASLSKLSNKRLNKLAKQGKLKKKLPRSHYLKLLNERTQPRLDPEEAEAKKEAEITEEKDIPLQEADYEYFDRPGRDYSFLSEIAESDDEQENKRRKRKRKASPKEAEETLESEYETAKRQNKLSKKEMRDLLPIKGKSGVIPQQTEVVESEEEMESEEEEEDGKGVSEVEKPEKPLPNLSIAELFAQRQNKLLQKKQKIGTICSSIIENPEENYGKLKELRMMLEIADADIQVTVKKLAMMSLMEVFKDIIPGYHIRLATDKEKEQSAKQETKKLRQYEEGLLNNYRHYLEFMEALMTGKTPKSKNKKSKKLNGIRIPEQAQKGLKEVALKCMCELLVTHPHFNFRTNMIAVVTPYMCKGSAQMSDIVCEYIKRIFKEDKAGEVTLEIVRLMGRMIKARNFDVKPKVLQTLLSLKIKRVENPEERENKAVRREKFRKLSRKDKKRTKQMGQLEKELQEVAAETDKKKTLRIHTEIINMVFLTYFRILKNARESVLLSTVLEGLAKHAHLINVDFFEDLFSVFNELVDSDELTYRESLHCVQTAFTILSGQGAALNIDPLRFYKHLYRTLFHLSAGECCEDLPIALECLDLMISKRRRQVSHQRVLAFIKRLATLMLSLETHGALGIMAAIRSLLHVDQKTDILFDAESRGSGVYLAELEDPEHCNANSTALWELYAVRRHYHPVVRKYANHICAKAPSQGVGQLSTDISRKSAVDLFKEYTPHTKDFFSSVPSKSGQKKKQWVRTDFVQEELRQLVQETNSTMEGINLNSLSFVQTKSKTEMSIKDTNELQQIQNSESEQQNGGKVIKNKKKYMNSKKLK